MTRNLSVVVVLDLEKPEALNDRFFHWIAFINQTFTNLVADAAPAQRDALRIHFETVFRRNKLLYASGVQSAEGEAALEQSLLDEATTGIEFSLGVPILIVAHKADALDTLDQKALDKIQLSLRTLAVRYGAAVVYTSAKTGSNLDTLGRYLAYALLGDRRASLAVNVTNDRLFVPVGFDRLEDLETEFAEAKDYAFSRRGKVGFDQPEKPEGGEEIIDPEQFLQNIKEGKMTYHAGGWDRALPSTNQPEPTAARRSVFEKPTRRIIDILERRRP